MSWSPSAWLSSWWRPDAARRRPPSRPRHPVTRVLTWNIRHGADAWDQLDLEAVAARIASTDADVALLQDVDRCWGPRSDDVDQTQWLAERLGMHAVHGGTRSRPRRDGPAEGSFGNAMLSRRPWTSVRVARFAEVPRSEPRGMVSATTQTPLGWARFCSTHLSGRRASRRSSQVTELLTHVRDDAAALDGDGRGLPIVLGGDLNAEPRDVELRGLSSNLVDAWRVAGRGLGDTTPTGCPWRRPDQVWVGGYRPVGAAVLGSQMSDHLPVLVDLAVPEPPSLAGAGWEARGVERQSAA